MTETFDITVRLALYREFISSEQPPTEEILAQSTQASVDEVRAALERLAAEKVIVLQPESRAILMANPLCAVPTPYRVRTQGRSYFASCVWDGLGIMAMLGSDALLDTSCACCGEAMLIETRGGQMASTAPGVVHFAVPAKRWWENIVFT